MSISELVGKRVLGRLTSNTRYATGVVEELKILEIAPSGNYIKLQNIYGNKFWKLITEFQHLETLTNFNLRGKAV